MSASNAFESDILKLIFQNVNLAGLGDATGLRGSTVAGSLYVALHTADPGETGDQTTSEVTYTGYARLAIARGAGTFTVSGTAPTQVANAADVYFNACTAGALQTATHFSFGSAASGAGEILISAPLDTPVPIAAPIQPYFPAGTLKGTAD